MAEPDLVPMFLAIDVEPDQDLDAGPRGPASWTGCAALQRQLQRFRGPLETTTGGPVRIGWYVRMDPQIEALCGSADHAAELASGLLQSEHGDYLGLHVHATYWDGATGGWAIAGDDPDLWLEHLRFGLDAFHARMGEPPRRHRFTRSFLTDPMVEMLAQAGVRIDLTPEPRPGPRAFSRTRHRVYEATSRPPLTVVCGSATSWPPFGGPKWRSYARRLRRLGARWYLDPYRGQDPTEYWDAVSRSLRAWKQPYVSLALKTQCPGSRAEERQRLLLDALVTHPLSLRLRFADPLELTAISES